MTETHADCGPCIVVDFRCRCEIVAAGPPYAGFRQDLRGRVSRTRWPSVVDRKEQWSTSTASLEWTPAPPYRAVFDRDGRYDPEKERRVTHDGPPQSRDLIPLIEASSSMYRIEFILFAFKFQLPHFPKTFSRLTLANGETSLPYGNVLSSSRGASKKISRGC